MHEELDNAMFTVVKHLLQSMSEVNYSYIYKLEQRLLHYTAGTFHGWNED